MGAGETKIWKGGSLTGSEGGKSWVTQEQQRVPLRVVILRGTEKTNKFKK